MTKNATIEDRATRVFEAHPRMVLGHNVLMVSMPWASMQKDYIVASPLLAGFGLPVVNVRAELAALGVCNFKLKPVRLPGSGAAPTMHLVTLNKAVQIIKRLNVARQGSMAPKGKFAAATCEQPELPFSTEPPTPKDVDSALASLDRLFEIKEQDRTIACLKAELTKASEINRSLRAELDVADSGSNSKVAQLEEYGQRLREQLRLANATLHELHRTCGIQETLVADLRKALKDASGVNQMLRAELGVARAALVVRDQKIDKLETLYDNLPPVPGVPTPVKTIQARICEHVNSYVRKKIEEAMIDTNCDQGRQIMSDYTHAMWEWVYREFKYSAKVDIVARHEHMSKEEQAKVSKLDLVCKLGLGEKLHAMVYDRLPVKRLKVD